MVVGNVEADSLCGAVHIVYHKALQDQERRGKADCIYRQHENQNRKGLAVATVPGFLPGLDPGKRVLQNICLLSSFK
jgi:hypothetical protein